MDSIGFDGLVLILSFVPYEEKNWLNVKLVCKTFLRASKAAFHPSLYNNLAILTACAKGFVSQLKELLEDKRVDPCIYDNSPLTTACHHRQIEIIEELAKDGRSDLSVQRGLCLKTVARYGELELLRKMIEIYRLDPSKNQWDVMYDAVHGPKPENTRELLKYAKDEDFYSDGIRSAFISCICNGRKDILNIFIDDGRIVPGSIPSINTTVQTLIDYRSVKTLELLMSYSKYDDEILSENPTYDVGSTPLLDKLRARKIYPVMVLLKDLNTRKKLKPYELYQLDVKGIEIKHDRVFIRDKDKNRRLIELK